MRHGTVRHDGPMPVEVRLIDRSGNYRQSLPDPAGGTFDAAGDFDRLLGSSGDLPLWSLIEPYGETRIDASFAPSLAAELGTLEQEARNGSEQRGLARLRVMAGLCAADAGSALLFRGD